MSVPDFFADIEDTTPDFFAEIAPLETKAAPQETPDFLAEMPKRKTFEEYFSVPEKTPEQLKEMSIPERMQYSQDLQTLGQVRQSQQGAQKLGDFFAAGIPNQKQFDVEEKTPEQLKAMSIPEKRQYIEDLNRMREYKQSVGLYKGVLSGASLGASSHNPELKIGEEDLLSSIGEAIGITPYLGFLLPALGVASVDLAIANPLMKAGIEALGHMTKLGIAGGTIESAKDVIETGEVPTASEIALHAVSWAALDGLLRLAGFAGKGFLKKVGLISEETGEAQKDILNNVIKGLEDRKISIEKDPEQAFEAAQEILDNYPRKVQGAREERIARQKVKEGEAEAKITEPVKEQSEKITDQQKAVIESRKLETSEVKESTTKKVEDLKAKGEKIDAETDTRLNKLAEKEERINAKFEEEKTKEINKLRKESAKDVEQKTNKVKDNISQTEERIAQVESQAKTKLEELNTRHKNKPIENLEAQKAAIESKKEGKLAPLRETLEKQQQKLEQIKEKGAADLKTQEEKIASRQPSKEAKAKIEKDLRELERNAAQQKKELSAEEAAYNKERERKIKEINRKAEDKLRVLQERKAELKHAQEEKLKIQREKAQQARQRLIPVKPFQKSLTNVKTQAITEPLIETTGKSAAQQIEYAQNKSKIVDAYRNLIFAAKTPGQSLKALSEGANEAVFNALAPLERLEASVPVTEQVTTRLKIAQSVSSEINSILENGIFSNLTGNFEHGGLKEAYGDLVWKRLTKGLKPNEYSLEELDVYRTSKAALKRQAEGRRTGVDTKEAMKDVTRLKDKYEPIDKRIREFQNAMLDTYGKDIIGRDLISLWKSQYYAPLFRVMETGKDSILSSGSLLPKKPFWRMKGSERKIIAPSESDPYNVSMLVQNARKNDAILQYRKGVEKGQLPGKIKEAKNSPVPDSVMKSLEIDADLEPVAETLYNQTRTNAFTPEKNILRGWKNGKPFEIEVPEDIYNVFASQVPVQRGAIPRLFGWFNRQFSKSISKEPRKFVSIVTRDALSSLIYSKTGSNPYSVVEALGDIWGDKEVYKQFLAMGGDVYASRLAERIERANKITDLITPGDKGGILLPFEKIGEFVTKYSNALDNMSLAVPLAEYKRALAKFGNTPEGRIMAAMEARRVTYDPYRKGNSHIVKEFSNYMPFANVILQDLSMLGQNLKRPETWVKGVSAMSLPTLALKMFNERNEAYQDLTPVDKAAFWHIYAGDRHIRIPIPWLLGTTFKVGAEVMYDMVQSVRHNDPHRFKEANQGIYENFVENVSPSMPPLLQTFIEQTTEKTAPSPLAFILGTETKAPDVVPRRLKDLPPSEQFTSKTSVLAKQWGAAFGVSPVKVDRFISSLGGLLAKDALAVIDEMAYATGFAEDKRPEQREANYLLLGNFLSKDTERRTKHAREFYEYYNEAKQNHKINKSVPGLSFDMLNSFNNQISAHFRAMRQVEDNARYSPAQKKEELNRLQVSVNNLYKRAVEAVRKAEKK